MSREMDEKLVQEGLKDLELHFNFTSREQVEAVKKFLEFSKRKDLIQELDKENLGEAEKLYQRESGCCCYYEAAGKSLS